MARSTAALSPTGSVPGGPSRSMPYGRSRLLLGISGVGTWVVMAAVALASGFAGWLGQLTQGGLGADVLAVAAFAVVVLLVQAPFDLLGGYLLPRRYGRSSEPFIGYAGRWLLGAAAYQGTYLIMGLLLLAGSRAFGSLGMVLVGIASTGALLVGRTPFACLVGGMRRPEADAMLGDAAVVMRSSDVGFTGGIEGVLCARRQIVPRRWLDSLSAEMLSLAVRRRREAVTSGLWLRGRVASLAFIWIGLAIAGWLARDVAGTAGGVVAFAAVFTLWSFLGLLVLPTLSRRASMLIDKRLADEGVGPAGLSALADELDSMQDDEPSRSEWIERVFHPIPSVTSRNGEHKSFGLAAWDTARTTAYLAIAGLSPLGRAVHCNSGRPSLWVYLPSD